MIVYTEDGQRLKVGKFYEPPETLKHIEDVDRLKRLHDMRLGQDRAWVLVQDLCGEFKLPLPTMRFTGYTDSGSHWSDYYSPIQRDGMTVDWKYLGSNVIVIRKSHISTEVLIHELAHHWVKTKMVGVEDRAHGFDFAIRLEKLAVAAERMIEEGL